MIVWSKGLGKQSLELELDQTALRLEDGKICLDGTIESVMWDYTLTMGESDLKDFLRILSSADTAAFVAREKGLFGWFLGRLIAVVPGVLAYHILHIFSGPKKGA